MPAGSARIAGVPKRVIDCRNATRESGEQRRHGQRQRHVQRGPPRRRAEDRGGFLEVAGDRVERVGDEREHVRKGVERHHEHHAPRGKDVDQRRGLERLQAEQRVVRTG